MGLSTNLHSLNLRFHFLHRFLFFSILIPSNSSKNFSYTRNSPPSKPKSPLILKGDLGFF
ncbi:unnamed protein product [Arabidopsis halleri]